METRAHYVAVGGFVLAIVFIAFVAVIWLAQYQFSTQYSHYVIYFRAVSGLTEGAQVQYNGVPVGRVANVRISEKNVGLVRVFVELNKNVVIKDDAVAGLETSLLSGVSFILISGGTKDAPVLTARKGEYYPVITSKRSSLERVYSRAPQLLERLIEVADSLNAVLNKHNQEMLAQTLDNAKTLSAGLDQRAKELGDTIVGANATIAELGTLLRHVDDSYATRNGLKDQATTLIGDYDRLAKGLIVTNGQLQGTVKEVNPGIRQFSNRILPQIGDLVADARQLVAGLTRLAADIERDPTRFLFGERHEGYAPR